MTKEEIALLFKFEKSLTLQEYILHTIQQSKKSTIGKIAIIPILIKYNLKKLVVVSRLVKVFDYKKQSNDKIYSDTSEIKSSP